MECGQLECTCGMEQLDAVVMVHGISPYQETESIERLIKRYVENRYAVATDNDTWSVYYKRFGNEKQQIAPYYEITGPLTKDSQVDFYEALWSDTAKNQIPAWRIAIWFIQTSLSPLRFSAPKPSHEKLDSELLRTLAAKRSIDALTALSWSIRIGILALLTGAMLALVLYAVKLCWLHPPFIITTFAILSMSFVIRYGIADLLALNPKAAETAADKSRSGFTNICAPLFVLVCGLIVAYDNSTFPTPLEKLSVVVVALGLVALAVALPLVSRGLNNYIGDIYIATRTDINDSAFKFRQAVVLRVADLIDSILFEHCECSEKNWRYKKIFIVAHSLGSVIALDALSLLRIRYEARQPRIDSRKNIKESDVDLMPLLRLTALVTYGSPLKKLGVFRNLHMPSKTRYEDYLRKETSSLFGISDGIRWVNYWCMKDVVSDPLADTTWLAAPNVIVDRKTSQSGKGAHGAYIQQNDFWHNATGVGLLDFMPGR